MYTCMYVYKRISPKNGEIALWLSTNGAIAYFLVLLGSLLPITEITEHKYLSPLKPSCEVTYIKVNKILYHWTLLLNPFCFCET